MCIFVKEPMEVKLDSGEKFCYVPVLKSLENLLNDEGVFTEVNRFTAMTCILILHVIIVTFNYF